VVEEPGAAIEGNGLAHGGILVAGAAPCADLLR